MKISYYLVLPLVLLFVMALMGCSGNEEKRLRYLESRSTAPLNMPDGMQQPMGPDRLPVVVPSVDQTGVDPRPPALPPQPNSTEADNP